MKKEDIKLNLVEDGIFPIVTGLEGEVKGDLDTGLRHSGTIQGEGKLVGTSALILRTSGCNLRCAWVRSDEKGDICDTPFSSWAPESVKWNIKDAVDVVEKNIGNMRYLIITGGEPMMQPEALCGFMALIKKRRLDLHITLETNGTLYDQEVCDYVDLLSISPKLSNSIPWRPNLRETGYEYVEKRALRHNVVRRNIRVIQAMIDNCYGRIDKDKVDYDWNRLKKKDFQLKFVVSDQTDLHEIDEEFLKYLKGIRPDDMILMPLGSNRDGLELSAKLVMSETVKRGWRFTPRLHIDLFDVKRSV